MLCIWEKSDSCHYNDFWAVPVAVVAVARFGKDEVVGEGCEGEEVDVADVAEGVVVVRLVGVAFGEVEVASEGAAPVPVVLVVEEAEVVVEVAADGASAYVSLFSQ